MIPQRPMHVIGQGVAREQYQQQEEGCEVIGRLLIVKDNQ
jgi:hypothetical protein